MNHIALFFLFLKGEAAMLEGFNKKLTKKFVDNAKEVIKEEASESINRRMPLILGVVSVGVILLAFIEPKKAKEPITSSIIIINNYFA